MNEKPPLQADRLSGGSRSLALTLALAMCVTGITMTGCGKIDYIGFDSYVGDGEGEMMSSEVTLKQALEANPEAVWFEVNTSSFSKSYRPNAAFQFKDGKFIRYPYVDLTMGEISQVDPKDLPNTIRTNNYNHIVEKCNTEIQFLESSIKSHEKVYQTEEGLDSREAKKSMERETQQLERLKKLAAAPETLEAAFVTATPYLITIYTDESGNYTANEGFAYSAPKDAYKIWNALKDGREPSTDYLGGSFKYGDSLGMIYDNEYGGFFSMDSKGALVTKINPGTTFVLDEPGTKDIIVDPSMEDIKQLLEKKKL